MTTLSEAERQARRIVNGWTAGAAAVGWVPGSMLALAAADMKIVSGVADAFGVKHWEAEGVVAAVGASMTGKVVAGELLSFVPVVGWAIKSGVAAGVTKAVGEAIIRYFKERSPYSDHAVA